MNTKIYAMRTFGIEIKEPALTLDEQILLMKIHETQRTSEYQEKQPEFIVDEEFSELCCEVWK